MCGFFAILTIFEGINQADSDAVAAFSYYQNATFLIFAACLFDLFDGRIARMRGQDGPFGREFDSLADIVSFGIAPALLVAKAVLFQLSPPAAESNLTHDLNRAVLRKTKPFLANGSNISRRFELQQ